MEICGKDGKEEEMKIGVTSEEKQWGLNSLHSGGTYAALRNTITRLHGSSLGI